MQTKIPAHPLAELFPLIEGAEFDELVASIKTNGLRDPIVIYEGSILDGRNRYRACIAAGVEPRTEKFQGADVVAFVLDKNLHRRHLNETQRGYIGANIATARQGENFKKNKGAQEVKILTTSPTVEDAARMLNVSRGTILAAKFVMREGTPDEVAALKNGTAAANTIARQIRRGVPAAKRDLGGRNSPAVQASKQQRIEKQRMKAQLWAQIRDGLTLISGLPRPADAVKIARGHDRAGLVDAKLFQSLNWLKEFAHEWSKRNETTAEAGGTADDADDHTDSGTGNAAS